MYVLPSYFVFFLVYNLAMFECQKYYQKYILSDHENRDSGPASLLVSTTRTLLFATAPPQLIYT